MFQSPESSPGPVTKPQGDTLAAVFFGGGALRDIQKTAARETTEQVDKTT